ncbi:GNAT family N-acetyltransferase [Marinibacterium profundimaris]|uniref:GNAT family N-acetyltransferase n=1 Tax=Marinibacterium profundimaris TaxID=1679460 RepID=UPI000B52483F|nr:GNAT family N-acetyltransferase [Marinibacterium profundimaris]
MKVEWIAAHDLDSGLRRRWRAVQSGAPVFRSPFFSVDFMRIVARHRSDLRLALLRDPDTPAEIAGFFPFHRRPGGRGVPLAGPIADYQGILGSTDGVDPARLLESCGLSHFDYDHALGTSPVFRQEAFRETASPLIDLGEGFDAWYGSRRRATSAIKTTERKMRKLEREIGPVRFDPDDRTPGAWDQLLAWKRAALADKGVGLTLDTPWVQGIARDIHEADGPEFSGRLSTLYAGDRLVAAHFGMRSADAWHWWFPAYDPEMSQYSPGLGLLLHCARQAAEDGMAELDLGRGSERYKREFASGARRLCEGSLERALAPMGAARRLRKTLHRVAENVLTEHQVDLKRRTFNRLLRAGRL